MIFGFKMGLWLMLNTFRVMRNIRLTNDFLVRKDALNTIPFPLIFRSLEKEPDIWCNQTARGLGFTEQRVKMDLEDRGSDPLSIGWDSQRFQMDSTPVMNLEGRIEGQLLWPAGAGLIPGSALLHTGLAFARNGQWIYINPTARAILGLAEDLVPSGWAAVDWLPDWDRANAKGVGPLLVTQHDGYEIRVHGSGEWMLLEAIPESLMQGERLEAEAVAALMHEVRNPLATLSARIELSQMRATDPELGSLLAETMAEIDRLTKITEDILWATRDNKIHPVELEIEPLIRRAWEDIERLGASRETIRFVLESPKSAKVLADPDRLRHIFLNLFKNAHEAMATTGNRVKVTITPGTGTIHCNIEDNGPGIPEDVGRNLFRVHRSSKPGGSGLGLTIVQRLIKAHGGVLTVESIPGRTRFSFDLPNPGGLEEARSASGALGHDFSERWRR